jgi:hypothetical protein
MKYRLYDSCYSNLSGLSANKIGRQQEEEEEEEEEMGG